MAILRIPVTKAKGEFVEVDTDATPEEVYQYIVMLGYKTLVNRGTTKITKELYSDPDELKVAALDKAKEQVEAIHSGKIRIVGAAPKSKTAGAIMTRARQLARQLVKDVMKREGIKVSHVKASEITKAANAVLATGDDDAQRLIAQAEAEFAASQQAQPSTHTSEIIKGIQVSPELIAAAEERKAKSSGQLSAKQAGKVRVRPAS